MARKVSAHLFSSLNGVSESPHLFQFDAFGHEEGEAMSRSLSKVTDVVIGRVLSEQWSQYWPQAEDEFGHFINPVRKHVVSSTLRGDVPWNSEVIQGPAAENVRGMKEQDGGDIAVVGGIETVRSLFVAGVIDALTLTIHPVVTNEGRRLFDETVPLTRVQMLDSQVTSAGNAILTYGLRA